MKLYIKNLFSCFRALLEKNKVFIDFFVSCVLGLMAILVSLAALDVSKTQVKLSNAQVSPHIRVFTEPIYDTKISKFTGEKIEIHNDGFPLSEFSADVKSLLKITVHKNGSRREVLLPVIFYSISFNNVNSTGLMQSFEQKNNTTEEVRLQDEFRSYSKPDASFFYIAEIINIVETTYVDTIGLKHNRIYLLENVTSSREITPEENAKFSAYYVDTGFYPRNIEKLRAVDVINYLKSS